MDVAVLLELYRNAVCISVSPAERKRGPEQNVFDFSANGYQRRQQNRITKAACAVRRAATL